MNYFQYYIPALEKQQAKENITACD